MRTITDHHDGYGLNDSMTIYADDLDPINGNASHRYEVKMANEATPVAQVQFQQGPRNVEGSKPGATEAVLLAILIDRIMSFQAGPFACEENHHMLDALQNAMQWTKARATNRAARGVLGTLQK